MKKCRVVGCNNSSSFRNNGYRGYCCRHYQQIRSYGKIVKRTCRDKNELVEHEEHYGLKLYNKKNQVVAITKIDKDDYKKIKDYKWSRNRSGYVFSYKRIDGVKRPFHIHRIIMDAPDDKQVDHINFNKLDNRKCNLRLVTQSENVFHRPRQCGIHIDKRCSKKKYFAIIMVNKKQIYLGHFEKYTDALKKRVEAEKIYFPNIASYQLTA